VIAFFVLVVRLEAEDIAIAGVDLDLLAVA
jgi:hypothetical protein